MNVMQKPEPTIRINVDPTNPGQFFACCGLLELADRLWNGAEGWFDDYEFCVVAIEPLESATFSSILNALVKLQIKAIDVFEHRSVERAKKPSKLAPLWVEIDGSDFGMQLDWWMTLKIEKKELAETKTAFKTWAANASSIQMLQKWIVPLRDVHTTILESSLSPFRAVSRIQGSYAFDANTNWNALDVGFSLNEHSKLKAGWVSPLVEILGALGLERFRPEVADGGRAVTYSTWNVPLLPSAAKAASANKISGVVLEVYETCFSKRGSFKGLECSIQQGVTENE